MTQKTKKTITALTLVSVLSGCAVVPKLSDKETPQHCELLTRSIELEVVTGGFKGMANCQGDTCAALLLGAAGVFTVSAIISSSIYVVGNTAHYLEKTGRCDDDELINKQVTEFTQKITGIGSEKIELEPIDDAMSEKEQDKPTL